MLWDLERSMRSLIENHFSISRILVFVFKILTFKYTPNGNWEISYNTF